MNVSDRLIQLGLEPPTPIPALDSYRRIPTSGNRTYVSGLGSSEDGKPIVGVVERMFRIRVHRMQPTLSGSGRLWGIRL
jgi:hypothetical protein